MFKYIASITLLYNFAFIRSPRPSVWNARRSSARCLMFLKLQINQGYLTPNVPKRVPFSGTSPLKGLFGIFGPFLVPFLGKSPLNFDIVGKFFIFFTPRLKSKVQTPITGRYIYLASSIVLILVLFAQDNFGGGF